MRWLLALAVLAPVTANVVLAAGPTVEVAAPSNEIGDAGAALGNVWDMNTINDIIWTQPNASGQTVNYAAQSGVAGAYGNVVRGVTPSGSDLASAFYTDANLSIPGKVYKYLLYRTQIAPQNPGEKWKSGHKRADSVRLKLGRQLAGRCLSGTTLFEGVCH